MLVKHNVSLADITYWKIGGRVKYYYEVYNVSELLSLIKELTLVKVNYIVLGRMTNILVDDGVIDGAIIFLKGDFCNFKIEKDEVTCGSGVFTPRLVRNCVTKSLSGIEHLIGVPASMGGIITMNGGSMRRSISTHIISVTSIDRLGNVHERDASECGFGYRESIFKYNNEIIVGCKLKLERGYGMYPTLRAESLRILKDRRLKFPRKTPNCGSVFKSSKELFDSYGPPGKIIEDLGLKGFRIGDAEVSTLHANFIVNKSSAKCADTISVIFHIMDRCYEKTSIVLEPEVLFLRSDMKLLSMFELYKNKKIMNEN